MSLAEQLDSTLKHRHPSQPASAAVLDLLREWDLKDLVEQLGYLTDCNETEGILRVSVGGDR